MDVEVARLSMSARADSYALVLMAPARDADSLGLHTRALRALTERLGDAVLNVEREDDYVFLANRSHVWRVTCSRQKMRDTHAHTYACRYGFLVSVDDATPGGPAGQS